MSSERESGITDLSLAGWKSKSLFIWSNDFFHISTVDSEMIIRLCHFTLEQGNNDLDWLQSLKHFFHKVFSASLFQVLVANLLLMAQFYETSD